MLLAKLLQLTSKIDKLKAEMINIASSKGLGDKQVLKISQDLDREILVLQRILLNK
ncbi:aspartyl-phosphate phosphatase Spo0E family protein [Peribacillus butanolivorans]|uniref:aspartyl-phosphate phosphatase Spo0E family protein n=1 Tax=Peribacillus butanolivorans TaxID=421767 RepID=UPI0034D9657D